MVKLYKLHKIAGLSAGLILLILGITGFFINHDQWSFLYTITFKHLPQASKEADAKLFDAYWVDEKNFKHRIVGGKRGIFETYNGGDDFKKMTDLQCLAITSDSDGIYAATSNGIYELVGSSWKYLALQSEYITAISLSEKIIVAVIQKNEVAQVSRSNAQVLTRSVVEINSSKLKHSIKLSRFVRDLHYGRGLFEGDISLIINDYAGLTLVFLAVSGYIIWWLIRQKGEAKLARKLIHIHANWVTIIATIPLFILVITGVFLDHSSALAKFMKSVTIPHSVLPPVYSTLKYDIWSVDFDGETYRIGNRYGIYKSQDLKEWDFENSGLAYKMIRKNEILYVSGMGAPNRVYDGSWKILKDAPHMFKDVIKADDSVNYFSTSKNLYAVPVFDDTTLYSLMLTLHDGTFFASWWVWVNDYASIALILLTITGVLRWYHKRKKRHKPLF